MVLSDGTVFGDPHQGQGSLVASASKIKRPSHNWSILAGKWRSRSSVEKERPSSTCSSPTMS